MVPPPLLVVGQQVDGARLGAFSRPRSASAGGVAVPFATDSEPLGINYHQCQKEQLAQDGPLVCALDYSWG